jgi:Carboxypeptidase regulatory-like domain
MPAVSSASHIPKNPFSRGVIHGRVVDAAGKPVSNATVALYSRTGKVLSWTKTDATGDYILAANPKVALDIQPSKNRGLLMQCVNVAENVVMAPVKVVGTMVANPGLTVAAAGVAIASGTPAPLEAEVIAGSLPNHQTAVQTQLQAQGAVAAQALGVGVKPTVPDLSSEGCATVLVEAAGSKAVALNPSAYWIEPPSEQSGKHIGLQAWVDTVKLPSADGKVTPQIVPEAYTLSDANVMPTMVAAGDDIHIAVKVTGPNQSDHPIRVFAREFPRNDVIELTPGKDPTCYEGTMKLDRLSSLGDATICIGAFRAEPVEVKLDTKNTPALIRFVKRLEDMQAGKQYGYDPMIMAGRNRVDVKLTVLSPEAETPNAAATPAKGP